MKIILSESQIRNIVKQSINENGPWKFLNRMVSGLRKTHPSKPVMSVVKNVVEPQKIPLKQLKLKRSFGSGRDHVVYESLKYPDRVFKVEIRQGEVDKWFKLFKKYPNVFPKVFNRGTLKNVDGEVVSFVSIEKLNVAPAHLLWQQVEGYLHNYYFHEKIPYSYQKELEWFLKAQSNSFYKNTWVEVMGYIESLKPANINKIYELRDMVNTLYKITPNPDIRKYNFGYDKNGKLKCLDI
jgi:hypothetical protein